MATKDHYLALDMLRGIAAYVVVLEHFMAWVIGTPPERLHGYLSVDFFFLLSGFVIAYAYEAKLRSTMTFGRFLGVRLIRLYPMIFLGFVFGAFHLLLMVRGGRAVPFEDAALAIAAHLLVLPLLVPTVFSPAIFPLNLPIWSLFFELAANVVHGLIAPRLSDRTLAGVVLVSFAAWLALGFQGGLYGFTINLGGVVAGWQFGFVRVAFPYFLGVLMFRLHAAGRLPRWSVHPLILMVLFLAAVTAPSFARISLELPIVAAIFPLILLLGANAGVQGWLLRPAALLGALSYPIYAVHVPIGLIAIERFPKYLGLHPSPAMTTALVVLTVTVGAFVVLKLFDEPLRRWLSAMFARADARQGGAPRSTARAGLL